MDVTIKCPFTMLVCGASGSGKTVFTKRLLEHHNLLVNAPKRVIWCYGVWQDDFKHYSYELNQGLPSEDLLNQGNMTVIIDDLMQQAKSNTTIADIFTKYSHHNNITCICLLQNLFPKGSEMRNISLNSNYIVLMKNSRDRAQIRHLAAQMYPGNSKFLVKSYEDATKDPYSYLMLDFRNTTPDKIRVRTGVLPGEKMFVYNPV
jgi:adenylate kinase family enzyme